MSKIIFNGVDYAGGSGNYFNPVIYSDTERKIGVWRDNKPLYAKTVSFTTGNTSGYLNYLTDIENPETMMIDFGGSFYLTGTAKVPAMAYFGTLDAQADTAAFAVLCNTDNNYLRLDYRVGIGAYSKTAYVTVLYTKTTDVAGSSDYNTYGVPTVHYSMNEQVIGTWIDGKPLYQRTWDFSSSPIITPYAQWVDTGISASVNIDKIISAESRYGTAVNSGIEFGAGAAGFVVGAEKYDPINNVRGIDQLTLRYTKTTD